MSPNSGIGWNPKFAESDLDTLYSLICDHPLGILVTGSLPSSSAPNIDLHSTYILFVLDTPGSPDRTTGTLGLLRGHIARGSPHAKALMQTLQNTNATNSNSDSDSGSDSDSTNQTLPQEAMVLFTSPTSSYITPFFYSSRKSGTTGDGKVVPTWFSRAVQVYGSVRLHHDASPGSTASRFLKRQLQDLTRHGESHMMRFPESEAWRVGDAPVEFVDRLSRAIVGVEIRNCRIEEKSKLGQEVRAEDQLGAVRGLRGLGTKGGAELAGLVEEDMRRKEERKVVLERDGRLVRGEKVKGPNGWYYTATSPLAVKSVDIVECGMWVMALLALAYGLLMSVLG
ncbi:hypothetical protein K491DRAFT_716847 [Lophiostoma macrostomum CBS 122681]|uniref:Uncharacterized protein n=1 Tax=Lophiostoma macrostomum CBS 122681 TaxID=1314788 RepID=A0A6A6T3Z2_9PLEO|nr:hypothetical protein K491DRAFT_716847 [Lophiostoma macrostomum CBS 122681]